jgi:hypothetical protein
MVFGVETENKHNGNGQHSEINPLHIRTKGGYIPSRFVTPGVDMSEAITATRIVNENQLNDILSLDAWLCRWKVTAGQQKLLKKTNGLRAVGGFSVAAMLQAHAQIITSEGLGVPTSAKSKKELEETKKHREHRDRNPDEDNSDDM